MPDVAGWVAERTLSKIKELAPPPPLIEPRQAPSPPMKPPVVQGAYSQQQGLLGVDTFLEPRNASGKGPAISVSWSVDPSVVQAVRARHRVGYDGDLAPDPQRTVERPLLRAGQHLHER